MKKLLTFFTLFIFSINFAAAQMPISNLDRFTHIGQLREGTLLVQLPNQDKKIARLKELGQNEKAVLEEKEVEIVRTGIMEGFSSEFHYTNIYFFESASTAEILEGNYEHLFDENKNPAKNYSDFTHLYVAQYGIGLPAGENSKYNGVGVQIRYVNGNQLEAINHDSFYKRSKAGIIMGKKNGIIRGIKKLNQQLEAGYIRKLKFDEKN